MVAPQQATLAGNEYLQLIDAPFIHPGNQFNSRSAVIRLEWVQH